MFCLFSCKANLRCVGCTQSLLLGTFNFYICHNTQLGMCMLNLVKGCLLLYIMLLTAPEWCLWSLNCYIKDLTVEGEKESLFCFSHQTKWSRHGHNFGHHIWTPAGSRQGHWRDSVLHCTKYFIFSFVFSSPVVFELMNHDKEALLNMHAGFR